MHLRYFYPEPWLDAQTFNLYLGGLDPVHLGHTAKCINKCPGKQGGSEYVKKIAELSISYDLLLVPG